jgi:hypothetical protein
MSRHTVPGDPRNSPFVPATRTSGEKHGSLPTFPPLVGPRGTSGEKLGSSRRRQPSGTRGEPCGQGGRDKRRGKRDEQVMRARARRGPAPRRAAPPCARTGRVEARPPQRVGSPPAARARRAPTNPARPPVAPSAQTEGIRRAGRASAGGCRARGRVARGSRVPTRDTPARTPDLGHRGGWARGAWVARRRRVPGRPDRGTHREPTARRPRALRPEGARRAEHDAQTGEKETGEQGEPPGRNRPAPDEQRSSQMPRACAMDGRRAGQCGLASVTRSTSPLVRPCILRRLAPGPRALASRRSQNARASHSSGAGVASRCARNHFCYNSDCLTRITKLETRDPYDYAA